ncbi:MAG TPA: LysR family transcriptional regulator substrate-binding protein [Terriglobales bacterium]|nr:LysR family transcriptional regulator substrate-binding protein [Terriglobales bacterium]
MTAWKGLRKGAVRIGSGPTLSSYILPLLLRRFDRQFPGIDLQVETRHTPALLRSLSTGALDLPLLVSSELLAEPNVSFEAFGDFEFALVSHLRHVPRRCALAELEKFPFILFQKGSRMESLIDRYFVEMDFRPRVAMRFDNADAIKAMIRTGQGISMLPMWSVDTDLRRGALRLIRQRERPLFSKIVLVSRKSSYIPRPVGAFVKVAQSFECRSPHLRSRP